MKILRPTITLFVALSIITGGVYPLMVTYVGKFVFPFQANGSFIGRDGKMNGSILIGQNFTDPRYFWGRPSATSSYPYHAAASGGSNLGPLNPTLITQVKNRVALLQGYPHPSGLVPVDLVTSSASGLDPHISPAAALYQIPRVAATRNMPESTIVALVQSHIQHRQFWLFGEPVVNVLKLNLDLDALPAPPVEHTSPVNTAKHKKPKKHRRKRF